MVRWWYGFFVLKKNRTTRTTKHKKSRINLIKLWVSEGTQMGHWRNSSALAGGTLPHLLSSLDSSLDKAVLSKLGFRTLKFPVGLIFGLFFLLPLLLGSSTEATLPQLFT